MTSEGVVTIEASRFRSQSRNREDATERLVELIRRATVIPKKREQRKNVGARARAPCRSQAPARGRETDTTTRRPRRLINFHFHFDLHFHFHFQNMAKKQRRFT